LIAIDKLINVTTGYSSVVWEQTQFNAKTKHSKSRNLYIYCKNRANSAIDILGLSCVSSVTHTFTLWDSIAPLYLAGDTIKLPLQAHICTKIKDCKYWFGRKRRVQQCVWGIRIIWSKPNGKEVHKDIIKNNQGSSCLHCPKAGL
jgi:hypothetical protein